MADKKKNTSAKVGIHGFHWAEIIEDSRGNIEYGEIHSIPFAQTISVSPSQEFVTAHGDNQVAEVATSNGTTEVGATFHEIPIEDRAKILGLETDDDDLIIKKGDTSPPDVGIVFFQDKADGSKEMVGLAKGKFKAPSLEGNTKTDDIEFSSMEMEAEFNPRIYDDISEVKVHIPKDDDTKAEAVFQKIFKQSQPSEEDESTEEQTDVA